MKIFNSKNPPYEHDEINTILKKMNSENGFFKVFVGLDNFIINGSISSISVLNFKNKFNFNMFDGESNMNVQRYFNLLNNFVEYNSVGINDLNSEVYSSFIAALDENNSIKIFKNIDSEDTVNAINSSFIYKYIYSKSEMYGTSNKVIPFIKDIISKTSYQKIINEIKIINDEFSLENLESLFGAISTGIRKIKERDEIEHGYDAELGDMNSNEKLEWIKKYGVNSNLFVIDVVNMTTKIFDSIDYNTMFNAEMDTLNRLSEKYKSFVNSINLNDQNCSLYKTIIYMAIFLGRDSIKNDPTILMNKLINRDSRWAVGTEKTIDPSFYGNSDIWKMFYGYGPFMTGKKNPFSEIIDNKQVDDMDRQAMLMHKWFKENGLSGLIYDLIYDKDVFGDNSIYDIISMTKELLALLEEPIVASSGIDNLTNTIKGIVSGMINSFVSTIDFSISGVARKLFYQKFIPLNGKKISIAEFHDYVAFVSSILKMYEDGAPIGVINKESFANNIYAKLSGSSEGFEKIGYGAFDSVMNTKSNLSQYEQYMHEVSKGQTFYLSKHNKVLYSLIMFAAQKKISQYGNVYGEKISFGNTTSIKSLISSLTSPEIFFVMHHFKVDFQRFNKRFEKYDIKEIIDFNNDLIDAQMYLDLDMYSGGFYKKFQDYNKEVLALEMKQTYFETSNYKKYINKSTNIYFDIVDKNKINLTKAVLDANNVSDVDDFLMRFLPSFEQLAKTLGFNTKVVSQITYLLDYICEFITTVLFKRMYMDIKNLINDYVKTVTDDIFTVIDSVGNALGGTNTLVVKFEFGGKFISGKLDSLLKILDDFTLTTKFLDKCFLDPDLDFVNIDEVLDNDFDISIDENYNNGSDKLDPDIIIVDKDKDEDNGNNGNGGGTGGSGGTTDKVDPDKDINVVITVIDKTKDDFIEKIIETTLNKKDPPKYITYDKGNITITTENGDKVNIINKDDKKDNGNSSISGETYEKIESEIISKEQIDQFIEIRDFIANITNQVILDLQNQLNSVKKDIESELNKRKPDNSKIKELVEKEKELIEKLDKVKEENYIKTNSFNKSKVEQLSNDELVLHDFSNGDLNVDKIYGVLDDLDDFSSSNKIPITTAQIMEILS